MRAAAPGMGMVVIGVVWVGVVKTFVAAGVWTAASGGAEVEATGGGCPSCCGLSRAGTKGDPRQRGGGGEGECSRHERQARRE